MSYAPTDDYAPARPTTPAVLWLIAANVAIYFVQLTVQQNLPQVLGFSVGELSLRRWWTPATYMFVHAGFWHLALNMYTLWAFGGRVERAWSTRTMVWFYLWCGLGGVVAQALLFRTGLLVGASAAVFGVMYAFARRWPDEEVLLFGVVPMKVKHLVWFLGLINLVFGALAAGQGVTGGTAYMAHLGGLAAGWLWFRLPSAPSVERLRQRVAAAPDVEDELPRAVPKTLPRPRERATEVDEIVEKSKALTARPQPPAPRQPAPARPVVAAPVAGGPGALDLVLDKISARGLDSLTADEKRLLEEASRKLRSE